MVDSWFKSDVDRLRRQVEARVRARLHNALLVALVFIALLWLSAV